MDGAVKPGIEAVEDIVMVIKEQQVGQCADGEELEEGNVIM